MHTSSRTTRTARITGALGALCLAGTISILPACGGDDGGGGATGGGRLSDEAFCTLVEQRLAEAEESDPEAFETEVFALIGGLANQAPTAELTSAMQKLGEVGETLVGIDEDDPEAFGEAFALMMDPGFMAAMETLDDYFTNTCDLDIDE